MHLAGFRRELADQTCGQVGHRRQVALPGRSQHAHDRELTAVERRDDEIGELRAHPGGAVGQSVGEPQQGGADNLGRCGITGGHAMV